MWGNVSLLMGTIGIAVVFAILLVAANAMMMSARERTRELAVLKTIGFTEPTLFGLVMLEAGFITVTGAVIGLGAAKLLYRGTNFNAAGFLPGFDVTGATLARRRRRRAPAHARERHRAGDAGRAPPGGAALRNVE